MRKLLFFALVAFIGLNAFAQPKWVGKRTGQGYYKLGTKFGGVVKLGFTHF